MSLLVLIRGQVETLRSRLVQLDQVTVRIAFDAQCVQNELAHGFDQRSGRGDRARGIICGACDRLFPERADVRRVELAQRLTGEVVDRSARDALGNAERGLKGA
jgi:hypothetical protein